MLKSMCCNAEVSVVMSPDFLKDHVEDMKIGTCYYQCEECGKACDVKEGVNSVSS